MEINDSSMRADFSLRRSNSLGRQVKADVKFRMPEQTVLVGDDRLRYAERKVLVQSVVLSDPTAAVSVQDVFTKSRADLYSRLIEWFDDLPCNCSGDRDDE